MIFFYRELSSTYILYCSCSLLLNTVPGIKLEVSQLVPFRNPETGPPVVALVLIRDGDGGDQSPGLGVLLNGGVWLSPRRRSAVTEQAEVQLSARAQCAPLIVDTRIQIIIINQCTWCKSFDLLDLTRNKAEILLFLWNALGANRKILTKF